MTTKRTTGILLLMLGLSFAATVAAEPLQTDLFVFMKPSPIMGKSPIETKYTVVDSSDPWAKKLYDTIAGDPGTREVLLRYQRVQMDGMKRERAKLAAAGKSTAEIDKELARKTHPIYFVLKDGKGTPMMTSGSAFIETYQNGKLTTDYQYICPKVSIPSGWEGFSQDKTKPFSESELKEFRYLIGHETSHGIMKEIYGYIPKGVNPLAAFGHWEGKVTTQQLAFTEGYADFMGAWFSGNQDFDNPTWNRDGMTGLPKTEKENRKTEGVVANIFWDITKGEGGITGGLDKIHAVFAKDKPWTITSFTDSFKKLYPNDAAAIDQILRQNLIPAKDTLASCWINLRSQNGTVAVLEKEYARLGWFSSPWKKVRTWWKLQQAKSLYKKLYTRYQSMFGYTAEQLTAKDFPQSKPAAVPAATPTAAGTVTEVKTTQGSANPFSE